MRAGEELSRQDGNSYRLLFARRKRLAVASILPGLNLLTGPRARRMPMEGFFFGMLGPKRNKLDEGAVLIFLKRA